MDATSYLLGKKAGGGGITPSGTISITSNGEKDVTNYATANVNVQPDLESKSVTITENTTTTITPTSGKDGLSSVAVTTNVSASVETIETLNVCVNQFLVYQKNIPNNYEPLYNVAKTLYTPFIGCPYYVIYKNRGGLYSIGWFTNGNSEYTGVKMINNYLTGDAIEFNINLAPSGFSHGSNSTKYYSVNGYETLEQAVNAIQNNQTQYKSSSSNSNYMFYDQNSIYYSNSYIYNQASNSYMNVDRISSNETIQAIE